MKNNDVASVSALFFNPNQHMKLKTTLTARNSRTETKLVVTTRPTGGVFTRWEQQSNHDDAVNRAHATRRSDYRARDIRFS